MSITILALLQHYLPGYKAGGPLRSVDHMASRMGEPFAFRIVTSDRDFGDLEAFPGVVPGRWYEVGSAQALYLRPAVGGALALRRVIAGTAHDVLYLNSLFSPRYALVPLLLRRLGLIPRRAVVLAPRGELHPGALRTGAWGRWMPRRLAARLGSPRYLKKRACIAVCRAAGMYRGITWQASTAQEAEQIRRHAGAGAAVTVAPNLAALPPAERPVRRLPKQPGALRAAWLSRVDAKKNLEGAIALLSGLAGQVQLDVYGPVTDGPSWSRCRAAIAALPANVSVRYHGPVPHEEVGEVFRTHDLFLFPTRGENYGHVVVEALVQGCPVLVSDQTPWRGLEALGVGWDVPLERPEEMRAVLQRCVDMDEAEFRGWSQRAAAFGRRWSADEGPVRSSRELFRRAAGRKVPAPPPPAAASEPESVGAEA